MSFGFGATQPQQQQSQSLFGSAQSQPLFGAPQSQPLFAAASSQSLFGAQQPQSQSLFGAPAAQSQSLFGAPQAQSQSLFGAPQAQSQSLFGAPQAQSQSLFGAPQPQSQSLFGAPQPQSQSLFGAPQAQSQSQSLFGAPTAQSQSLFGAPQSQSLFGAQPSQPNNQYAPPQPQSLPPPTPLLPTQLTDLMERLNPNHVHSPFHTALYNQVPPHEAARYTRPAAMCENVWQEAMQHNPDPWRLIPVQANLFDDLETRIALQEARQKLHQQLLMRVKSDMEQGRMIQEESNRRLATCRRRQRELARRVLRVAGMVDAAAKLGCVLNSAEIERWKRVDHVASACAHGDFAERLTEVAEVADGSGAGVELHMRDGRKIEALRALLKEQLRGIAHLGDVCDTARRDVALMTDGLAKHHR